MAQSVSRSPITLPELLELILLQADFLTLVKAQRVYRFWSEVIKNSPKIQEALFFRPSRNRCRDPARNGLQLNPLIGPDWLDADKVPNNKCSDLRFPNHEAWDRNEASWKRMLITQPPWKCLGIFDFYGDKFTSIELNPDSEPDNDGTEPFRLDKYYKDNYRIIQGTLGEVSDQLGKLQANLDSKAAFRPLILPTGFFRQDLAPCDVILLCWRLDYSDRKAVTMFYGNRIEERWLLSASRRFLNHRKHPTFRLPLPHATLTWGLPNPWPILEFV